MAVPHLEASFQSPTSALIATMCSITMTLKIARVLEKSVLRVSGREVWTFTAKIQSSTHRQPTEPCRLCHRKFFGDDCHTEHLMSSQINKSLCGRVNKCPECYKQVREGSRKVKHGGDWRSQKSSHRCGMGKCNNCEQFVDVALHNSYIHQSTSRMMSPQRKRKVKKVNRPDV